MIKMKAGTEKAPRNLDTGRPDHQNSRILKDPCILSRRSAWGVQGSQLDLTVKRF
jgi:hypothetical protein